MLFQPDTAFYAAKMKLVLALWAAPSAATAGAEPVHRPRRTSVARLAHQAGLRSSYIHHLLAQRITQPSHNHLVSLALAVGFAPGWWAAPLEEGPPQPLAGNSQPPPDTSA